VFSQTKSRHCSGNNKEKPLFPEGRMDYSTQLGKTWGEKRGVEACDGRR